MSSDLDGGSTLSIRLSKTTAEIFSARLCRFYKCITNVKKPLSSPTIYLRVSVQNLEVHLKNSYHCFICLRMCLLCKVCHFQPPKCRRKPEHSQSSHKFKLPLRAFLSFCHLERAACNSKRKMGSNTTQQYQKAVGRMG